MTMRPMRTVQRRSHRLWPADLGHVLERVAAGFSLRNVEKGDRILAEPTKQPVRERPHRLSKDLYTGEAIVAFTACVAARNALCSDFNVVEVFAAELGRAAARHTCAVVVYCFMPDQLHVLLQGTAPDADLWRAMVLFKQQTGYWLKKNRPHMSWQKDFHDRVLRQDENLVDYIRYIANNPVRARLVKDWREYPSVGSDTLDLEETLGAA